MIKTQIESWIQETFELKTGLELKKSRFADFSLVPGQVELLQKSTNLSREEIVEKLEKIKLPSIEKILFENGYINLFLTDKAKIDEINNYSKPDFIKEGIESETEVIDYSGPNIAKPFSVGHLRSTVIGQANYNIHKALGKKAIGINHLGDWGTQFGKLIYAVTEWGDEEEISKDPINNLNSLYVRFHEESEKNPSLDDEARAWSKKLEDGNPIARELWKKCVDWSMLEFDRIYKILNVKIDNTIGESFFEDKLDEIVDLLTEKNLLKESEGALIVELEDLPAALIKRKDGAALYMTRDLAAVKYRINTFNPKRIIYHVGQDQQLHFKQLVAISKKLGWLEKTEIVFAGHGMMRLPEGKMSTRKGRVVLLNDLIEEAKRRVIEYQKGRETQNTKGKELELAVSAIKYADLSTNRQSDVSFSFDRLIDLKGNSAIYLEYTYARIKSLILEFDKKYQDLEEVQSLPEESIELVREGIFLLDTLTLAMNNNEPSILCEYAYQLANKFNSFYEKKRIITSSKKESEENIFIVKFCEYALGLSLDLLGLNKFDKI
jgi:arginyl-tRNA synthetase